MGFWPEHLQISCESSSVKVEDLGIALRVKAPSCHLSNPVITTKCRKLMHKVNSCSQHIEGVWNSNNSTSFVPNSVPNRKKNSLYQRHVLLLLLLLLLCASCVDVVHCNSPQNVARNIGDRVFMNCSSSDDDTVHPCQNMVWAHYPANNPEPTFIFMGGNLSSLVSHYISVADSKDGKCHLEIKTRTSAEGKYECFSTSSTGKKASALLTILDGYPECAFKTVGEYSNITCWVKYFGDWAPTIAIEWIRRNSTSRPSTSIGSYDTYTSDQIVGATVMIHRNAHSSYRFIMKFNEQGRKTKTTVTATNIPHYEWISPIFVLGEDGGGEGEGEGGGEEEQEVACPQQMCSAGSFGFNGRVVFLSLFLRLL